MAKLAKQVHPLRYWMRSNGCKSVNALYLKLNKNKALRTTIYKLLSNSEVSNKKLEYLLDSMVESKILGKNRKKKLYIQILVWKTFPEYRGKTEELKKLF